MGHRAAAYLRDGELAESSDGEWPLATDEEQGGLALARALLADDAVRRPPAFVLDLGVIEGRGWAVVEANPAWGAGVCGCDPNAVLPVLRRSSRTVDLLVEADRVWVRTLR